MEAFAAGRLAEDGERERFETRLQFERRRNDAIERDIGRRIEIEDETSRHLRLIGARIPGVNFDAAHLRYGGKTLDAIDLQIGLVIAR